ncbi:MULTISPECIES: hypothetical protein [Arthrobacter]|uniref:Uncharacterized protein n=1 Tax=Arthrobacter terricola TaxID=2547396 RepID=A0A4R5KJJ6_9MICC|nr:MULTISPECIES: hypothetical protein [Arthrobacter]MBT8161514.1 hypothetical protein [Arthrobacter sp. GN70]TDF95681.1 hypothetical protein E1809_11715 [Arthrobacter terricola]
MKRTIATLGVVGLGLLGAAVSANAAPTDKITICHATHSAAHPYVELTIDLSALSGHAGDANDIIPANSGNILPNGQNLTPENIAILNAGCKLADPPVVSPPVTSPPATTPPVDPPATTPPVDPPATTPPVDPPATTPPVDPPATTPPATTPPVDPPATTPPESTPPASTPPGDQSVPVTPVVPPVAAPAPEAAVPGAAPVSVSAPVAATPAPAGGAPAVSPTAPITNVGYNVQTAVGARPGAGIPAWLAGLTGLFGAVAAFVIAKSGMRSRKAHR